jgi:hypothetical protein
MTSSQLLDGLVKAHSRQQTTAGCCGNHESEDWILGGNVIPKHCQRTLAADPHAIQSLKQELKKALAAISDSAYLEEIKGSLLAQAE